MNGNEEKGIKKALPKRVNAARSVLTYAMRPVEWTADVLLMLEIAGKKLDRWLVDTGLRIDAGKFERSRRRKALRNALGTKIRSVVAFSRRSGAGKEPDPGPKSDAVIDALRSSARLASCAFVESGDRTEVEVRLSMSLPNAEMGTEQLKEKYIGREMGLAGMRLLAVSVVPKNGKQEELAQTEAEWVFRARFPNPTELMSGPKALPLLRNIPLPAEVDRQTMFFRNQSVELDNIVKMQRGLGKVLVDLNAWRSVQSILEKVAAGRMDISELAHLGNELPPFAMSVVGAINDLSDALPSRYRTQVRSALLNGYYAHFYPPYEASWRDEVMHRREELFRCYDNVLAGIANIPGEMPDHLMRMQEAMVKNAQALDSLLGITPIANFPILTRMLQSVQRPASQKK